MKIAVVKAVAAALGTPIALQFGHALQRLDGRDLHCVELSQPGREGRHEQLILGQTASCGLCPTLATARHGRAPRERHIRLLVGALDKRAPAAAAVADGAAGQSEHVVRIRPD
eukprot:4542002-Prymnesium_polylepis.2